MLGSLSNTNRKELVDYRNEINQFIRQIKNEQTNEVATKKPVHNWRIKNWEAIRLQIEDKMDLKDYQEYLKIYNNTGVASPYFSGFEILLSKYKEVVETREIEKIRKFVANNTNFPLETIRKDFI